jgi:hypothetical protein
MSSLLPSAATAPALEPAPDAAAQAFIARWGSAGGSELANAQSFVIELCELLGVERPAPAGADAADNAYAFERGITFQHPDGSTSAGRIDLYRRGCFVLESKKVKRGPATKGFDEALMKARAQAEAYARALPAAEGRPPFLVVVDVGHVIELYAEFTRSGGTYSAFPDPRNSRIPLARLAEPAVRARLRQLWLEPMALDPSRISAQVTREVAAKLAQLARDLEAEGHGAERVAAFLTRCLFSMFAEDVGLLPQAASGAGAFVHLLRSHQAEPDTLRQMLRLLWADMDRGGFSGALAKTVLRFNGKLFKGSGQDDYVLPLSRRVIQGLLAAAQSDWRNVEPAIIGTLLERALDPAERHALGAHYTPRAYVERLVLPTVVEPLRADWADAEAAALLLATEAQALEGRKRDDKLAEARAEIRRFHHQLCTTRVLDPACGSGNFLYVTLEHLKRLEAEVLHRLEALGDTQARLGLEGETVTPKQLLGIEINERAAALAELVLWIGYLQWQLRTQGSNSVAEPVIHDHGNIERRDAVLAYDGMEPLRDAAGALVTRWDGKSFKPHSATGEPVPDEAAQVAQWRYLNPRPAMWPEAEFIVGNPPFIGASAVRAALGDGYAQALRAAWPQVPESADFVMHWWQRAAETVRAGRARAFGLITTNSIRQTFNRRVIEAEQLLEPGLVLSFAIADHPWVDSAQGAAVRIAMSVGQAGSDGSAGRLLSVVSEAPQGDGEVLVAFAERRGSIHADFRVGAQVARAEALVANSRLSSPGVKLHGAGFIVTRAQAESLGLGTVPGLEAHIREYRNGRDLAATSRDVLVIDLFGLSAQEVRARFPAVFQWVHERVKPERDQNNRATYRDNWWIFGEPRRDFRPALRSDRRYVATIETSRHRTFQFLDASVLPDNMLIAIATADGAWLGVLSSDVHVAWALAAGGRLGIGNDPRYNKTRCFETYPFPHEDTGLDAALAGRIRALAEQLDAHRKSRQAAHPELTLTGLYNVLEKLRTEEPLSARERVIHEQGLVSVLRSLHDELDAAVLQAYGWSDLAPMLADHRAAASEARAAAVDTLLERLVALNARRAAEEAAGTVRWLRPEFQNPGAAGGTQATMDVDTEPDTDTPAPAAPAAPAPKRPWPTDLHEQIKAVAEVLAATPVPLAVPELEARFTARGRWRERLPTILNTLEALGRARPLLQADGVRWQGV